MLSGDQCNGVSELAEGHTYIRGRCKQLGNLYSPNRDDGRCFSNSDYEFLLHTDEFGSPVDAIEKQSEDICRRVSMTPGDVSNEFVIQTPTNENPTTFTTCASDRRSSRDIGIQAFSLEIEEEKKKASVGRSEQPPAKTTETKRKEFRKCSLSEQQYILQREHQHQHQHQHQPSILLRRDSCHFHKLISPRNEIIVAHCPGTTPIVEYTESFDTFKSHDGATSIEVPNTEYQKPCYCFDHCHDSMDSTDTAHQYSTTSSDSSIITKIAVDNADAMPSTVRRPSTKWRSSLVYFMDPCIEDSTEHAAEEEYNEREQTKPLLEKYEKQNEPTITTLNEKRSNYRIDDAKARPTEGTAIRNVEESSGRPSFLKLVTLILIGSAILITSAAIKEAYY